MSVFFSRPLFSGRGGPSRLLSLITSAHRNVRKKKTQFQLDSVLQPAWVVEIGLGRKSRACRGDIVLQRILFLLDNMGVVRTSDQTVFHNVQIRALLPLIYGKEWARESERVMKEFGITRIDPRVLIFARRRLGKTWSVAMLVVAVLLSVENFHTIVISTGGRISSKLRDTCLIFINAIEGAKQRIFISGETMYVRAEFTTVYGSKEIKYSKNVSTLSTYPSDADRKPIYTPFIMQLSPDIARYVWFTFVDLETRARVHTNEWEYSASNQRPEYWPEILAGHRFWERTVVRDFCDTPLTVIVHNGGYSVTATIFKGLRLGFMKAYSPAYTAEYHRNRGVCHAANYTNDHISVILPNGLMIMKLCPVFITYNRRHIHIQPSRFDIAEFEKRDPSHLENYWANK